MTAMIHRNESLPSLDKARALLERSRSTQEVMRIKALAQAVAAVAATEQARDEAAAIVLLAKARIGSSRPRSQSRCMAARAGARKFRSGTIAKATVWLPEGISRKDAAECEKIAGLKKSGDLDRLIKRGHANTTAAALHLHRLTPSARREVFAKLGDSKDFKKAIGEVKLAAKRELAEELRANPIVTPDGRYQVIAIDPPWKYDSRAEDVTHRGKNLYPEMTVEQIPRCPSRTSRKATASFGFGQPMRSWRRLRMSRRVGVPRQDDPDVGQGEHGAG